MIHKKAPNLADELLNRLLFGTSAVTALQQGGLLDEVKKGVGRVGIERRDGPKFRRQS